MQFNKNMIVRIVVLVIVLINQFLIGFGFDPLPFTDEQIYEAVSTVATVVMALIATYFDTDITKQARQNKKYLKDHGMK
ncbi:phage holin [Virgibacillus alimentarius]|uniref:phage holin n=1 Tax=Virgibacillus alimentarius TaxID=698769 RepID=UPI0004936357|nr:phage holin [Virgibacillus alimentarius]